MPSWSAAQPSRLQLAAGFDRIPVQRVLKFLDDRISSWEELPVLTAHEPARFLLAGRRQFSGGWRG